MGKENYPVYYAEPLNSHTNNAIYEEIARKESPAGRTTTLGLAYGLPDCHKVWMISKGFYYNFLKKREKELKLEFNILIEYAKGKARMVKRKK